METKTKVKKTVLIVFSSIILAAVIVIAFISPITKYVVEKYDEKYTGRQIKMDWAYVNPFTGYVYFKNLKIYELNSDSLFFSASGTAADFEMFKLFSKTYEITQLTLNNPNIIISQTKKEFNLDDLVKKFSGDKKSDSPREPTKFSIVKIKINSGELHYRETITPIHLFIKQLQLESSGIHWDSDTIAATCSFRSGVGKGDVKGNFCINTKNSDYRIDAVFKKLDLGFINQYLKDVTNHGNFRAFLDADLKTKGNFKDAQDLKAKGKVTIYQFHFGKKASADFAAFDKLIVDINYLNPKNHLYLFDSLLLTHPYFKYEKYDHLDNIQVMFGEKGSLIAAANNDPVRFNLVLEIGKYIQELTKNFFKSKYKINRLAVYKGDFRFKDYSLSEEFNAELNPLYVLIDSVNKDHERVNALFKAGIKPYGDVSVLLSINPKDSSDFDMQYHLINVPAAMFNPYIITYTSFPLDRGTLELNGKWKVRNGMIQSTNHLVIIDPRVTERSKNKDVRWIPMPLIFFFIRERGNVIDYQIPISGNLKSPYFHLRDVFIDVIENIFIKPPTTPYRVEVKNTETKIEKSLTLKWKMRSSTFTHTQEKFIKKMADFLVQNPKEFLSIYPEQYAVKEKEYILFFEAKKKYFLEKNDKKVLSDDDSLTVDKMSVKDSVFVYYLYKKTKSEMLHTIQDKCALLIDSAVINAKFNRLEKERMKAFISYFKEKEVENQIKIHTSKNVIPYNGFSFYKIEYKHDLPETLVEALQKMNKLNAEPPRKKFEREREKYWRKL